MAEIKCSYSSLVKLKDLKPHPKNRNKHPPDQIERFVKILSNQGIRRPIRISKLSGYITAGHGLLLAAKKLKIKELPCDFQDYADEAQEYADIQADNALASWAELDFSGINLDIGDYGPDFDIDLLGIKNFSIDVADKEPQCDEDEVPEFVEPKTKLGDIYTLGDHRLLCGDSTSIDAVEKLMNSEKADICFTSPPYNVGKTPNGNKNKYITYEDNQENEKYLSLLFDFTTNCLTVTDYVFVNIQSLSGNKIPLIDYLAKMKKNYADTIIWDKESAEPAMAHRVLNSQFEYIHIFSKEAKRTIGKKDFRGTVPNIFRLQSRSGKEFSKIHKATFRVELPEYFIKTFCEESVIDPFAGTGTTMIAAEKCGVRSFNIELDPKYCDVIVARWEKYTGKKAVLNG